MMPVKKTNRINCLDRALNILEAFTQTTELGVSELSRRLNLHVATIHNLVKTLALRNYLININGRYRLGPAAETLSASWNPNQPVPQLLDPVVYELSRTTGELAVATVLIGFQAKIITVHKGDQDVSANYPQVIRPFPLSLATGQVLVAFGPEVLWEQFVSRHRQQEIMRVNGQKMDNDKWINAFQTIRAEALADVHCSGQLAVSAIAAPVFGKNNRIVASIGVSCPSLRFTGRHIKLIKKEVVKSAKEASKLFGGVPAKQAALINIKQETK